MEIPRWGNKTILLVEDDEISLEFLLELLTPSEAKILVARDGMEAVDLCREEKNIDLILMDVQLPTMSGKDAMYEIRKFNQEVCIIAQTAFAMSGDKEIYLSSGFNDYISKPINVTFLIEKLMGILSK